MWTIFEVAPFHGACNCSHTVWQLGAWQMEVSEARRETDVGRKRMMMIMMPVCQDGSFARKPVSECLALQVCEPEHAHH